MWANLNIYRYMKKTLRNWKKRMAVKHTVITLPDNLYWIMFKGGTSDENKLKK